MARAKRKTVKDLAKRRHVRTAQWRLPTGDADVAALDASRERLATLIDGFEITQKAASEDEREAWQPRIDGARERLAEIEKDLEKNSEAVTFREIPHHVVIACRARSKGESDAHVWALLAAARWEDRAGVEHVASDFDGTEDDWLALVSDLTTDDLDALAGALTKCIRR